MKTKKYPKSVDTSETIVRIFYTDVGVERLDKILEVAAIDG